MMIKEMEEYEEKTMIKYIKIMVTVFTLLISCSVTNIIQLKGDYVYFGISDKQSSDKTCIYFIPKSAF